MDCLVHLAGSFIDNGLASRSAAERYQVIVHVDADVLVGKEGTCHVEDSGPLAAETVQKLCCDSSLLTMLERNGKFVGVGRKTRKIPRHLRRALVARDKGCVFPGCGRAVYTEGHHIKSWAEQGETELENLALLCRFHHRLVHEGGYRVELGDDGVVHFFNQNGLELSPSPRLAVRGPTLARRNEQRGIVTDSETIRGTWDGAGVNLGRVVGALADMDARPDKYPENQAAP
ncbi:MAG: DUF222 domain-containing protein [Actinomycetota bacterium]